MTFSRRQFIQSSGAALLPAGIGRQAWAQALESTKIIAGFAPGGTADTVSRRVADKLHPGYAKNALVENKTGAGGQIAVQFVKTAAPDGATVLLTPMSMLGIYPHTYKKLPYDPGADLTPVSVGAVFEYGLAVGPMVPASVKTAPEFLAWCKANPALDNFGSPAAGSAPHFIGALLGRAGELAPTLRRCAGRCPPRGSPRLRPGIAGSAAGTCTNGSGFVLGYGGGFIPLRRQGSVYR